MDGFSYSHERPQVEFSPLTSSIYQTLTSVVKIVAEDHCRRKGYQTMTIDKSDLESFVESLTISHGPIYRSREEQRNLTDRDFEKDCKTSSERVIQTEFVNKLSGRLEVSINPRTFNGRAVADATNNSTKKRTETVKCTKDYRETEGANNCLKTDVIVESVVVPCTLKIHKDVKIAIIVGNTKTLGTVAG